MWAITVRLNLNEGPLCDQKLLKNYIKDPIASEISCHTITVLGVQDIHRTTESEQEDWKDQEEWK